MIREATMADCPALWKLMGILEDTTFDYPTFERIYRSQRQDGRHITLVWCADGPEPGEALALMNMRVEEQLHHVARIAEVQELVVSPELRGQGVGAQLLAAAREAACDRGCVRMELVTNQRRHGAHRFYEREGMNQSHFGYTLDL